MHHKPAAASSSFSSSSSSHLETESAHFLFPSFLPSFVLGIIYVPAIFFSYPLPPSPRDLTGSAIIHLVDKNWGLFPTLSPPLPPWEELRACDVMVCFRGRKKYQPKCLGGGCFRNFCFFSYFPQSPYPSKTFSSPLFAPRKKKPFCFFLYDIFFGGGGERKESFRETM